MLIGRAQPSVEGEHLDRREVPSPDRLLCVPDLVLAGEEDEHVAVALAGELVEGRIDAVEQVDAFRYVVG